jgi:hypothetical protein
LGTRVDHEKLRALVRLDCDGDTVTAGFDAADASQGRAPAGKDGLEECDEARGERSSARRPAAQEECRTGLACRRFAWLSHDERRRAIAKDVKPDARSLAVGEYGLHRAVDTGRSEVVQLAEGLHEPATILNMRGGEELDRGGEQTARAWDQGQQGLPLRAQLGCRVKDLVVLGAALDLEETDSVGSVNAGDGNERVPVERCRRRVSRAIFQACDLEFGHGREEPNIRRGCVAMQLCERLALVEAVDEDEIAAGARAIPAAR